MKSYKKYLCIAVLLLLMLCLGGCAKTASVTEITLDKSLPVWMLKEEHTVAKLPDNAKEQGLIGAYVTDTDLSDVYVYRFPGADGVSLEEFGGQKASERHIFCNMLTDREVPAAVLNYHDTMDGEHYIVQAYIYQAGADFIEVRTLFKTKPIAFGASDLSIHMIREYEAEEQKDSPLLFDTEYRTENERLPLLRIRQFPKDDFPVEVIEPELLHAVSEEEYAALAGDGWTLEEIVSLYREGYDISKGEVVIRNGLPLAFIGYIDDGIFKTRAFIEDGTDYILLSAEAEVMRFQHVTNALIDAIEKD